MYKDNILYLRKCSNIDVDKVIGIIRTSLLLTLSLFTFIFAIDTLSVKYPIWKVVKLLGKEKLKVIAE